MKTFCRPMIKIQVFWVSKIHHQLTYHTPFHLVYMYVPHFQGIVSMQKESLLDRYLPNPHGIAAHEHHNHRPRTYTLGGFCYYCANAALLFSFSWRCILIHTKNTTPMEKKEISLVLLKKSFNLTTYCNIPISFLPFFCSYKLSCLIPFIFC